MTGLQGLCHCQTVVCNGGGGPIKVSQKKTEDVEEGSSGRKKQKRKEDEEIEAEFGLVVEELWGRVVRKWEESERWQEQRWAAIMATLEHITDDVQELLDGLVPKEKEKGKEKGVEMDAEEMEMEETEEVEELGETGAGAEKDRDREMEVEETLKEAEKSADEVENDVMVKMYNNKFLFVNKNILFFFF